MQSSAVFVVFLAAAVVAIAGAYNDDRPIYKWSPLWFNSYLRRGVLHKRFNDDSPIYKWSPMWLDSTAAALQRLHYNKRGSMSCLDAGAECPVSGETSLCCSGVCHQGFCLPSASSGMADYEYDR